MEDVNLFEEEFGRLKDQTYLDHAGATLYAESQINNASKALINNLYLNPHTSKQTSDAIDQIRFQILKHFNTDHKEYTVIFTSGSSAALKLVAESFEFNPEDSDFKDDASKGGFVYLQDNHTSVLGMREIVTSKSAEVICIPHKDMLEALKNDHNNVEHCRNDRALCVYPAQCNFSGFKYPLNWIERIKRRQLNPFLNQKYNESFASWSVMLDAAAFVSTNKLDLSKYKPDFVCMSFYKIFGFPTGIGALLVKNSSAYLLDGKKYYGGGTVEIAMSGVNYHVKRKNLHERFEDGTIPFLSILSLKHGFDILTKLIPKHIETNCIMDAISNHTFNLAKQLYHRLKSLQHYNGKEVALIYADTIYDDLSKQGGIVSFNLLRANGDFIGYSEVTYMAQLFNIHLRFGCFCNPGACQRFLKLSNEDLLKHHDAGHVCGDNHDLVDGSPTGSLRVSFGYMSNANDIENLIQMIEKCFKENHAGNSNSLNMHALSTLSIGSGDDSPLGILHEIHIFPLKSCGAFKIKDSWEIGPKGFKYDREWMIVTETGGALSQKQDTRICLICPVIDLKEKTLILTFPGASNIKIPLEIQNGTLKESSLCHSKVCGDKIIGYDCGDDVAKWLLDVLGIPGLRLIRQTEEDVRISKKKNTENNDEIKQISFNNVAQYLVINLTSVRWLASRVESGEFVDKIDNLTDRFRGNLIIETKKPFEEFTWKNITYGKIQFCVDGPCRRCQMVCIDQHTGEKTIEPLRTISKNFEGKLNFGAYLSHMGDISEETNLTCGGILYNS